MTTETMNITLKTTINWTKYPRKTEIKILNLYLNLMNDPRFPGMNRLFELSFENVADRTVHKRYYLPKLQTKDYNTMIDGTNFFDQAIKTYVKVYKNIRKNITGQGDDYYTNGCLIDYHFSKNFIKS